MSSCWALNNEEPGRGTGSLRALAFIGIFLAWWILTALVYRHTQSNFLRAESGWYLFLSHSAPAVQHDFEKVLLSTSFKGHYTPFAFLAEFMTARLVGTHAGFWKWRQITVLAVLATMVFLFVRNSGSGFQLSRIKANLCAAGLTTVLIFQAQMRYFVAWPFMILQLFWLLCTVITWMSLIQMVRRPAEKLWPWLAAGTAYASLHFFGLGLATVGATAAVLAGIWVGTRDSASSSSPKVILPLLSMIALTALHTVIRTQILLERRHSAGARLAAHLICGGVAWFHSQFCPGHGAQSLQRQPASTERGANRSRLALWFGDPPGLWFSR